MVDKVLWQPLIGVGSHVMGVYLDGAFAASCDAVPLTEELHQRCESYVWKLTKPGNKTDADQPSDIFTYYGQAGFRHVSNLGPGQASLLISGVYVRHYASDGKWLTCDDYKLSPRDVLEYSFHHASRPEDHVANRWLWFAFDRWVQFAHRYIEKHQTV